MLTLWGGEGREVGRVRECLCGGREDEREGKREDKREGM